ncbi:ABC transporter ATP-binding protein [Neomegalonema sp.]|uniref:ABC transporter ATP-binding protein n=1 Tax=Neomegalonema sp. TaxID=2039713 RepID=UPI00261A1C09|nr:ABC transporter ATP-binding protein [Neomegalonema sp.]MDD2869240.1 ABC transporter ATP-binding protein [Neomegalonema sp.]
MSQPLLSARGLTKRFPGAARPVVEEAGFDLAPGEILALIGPSGCGKTTTLRMIGGFETPDSGEIRIEGRDALPLAPEKRGVGVVFQDYALFPHLTVTQNVAFGVKGPRLDREAEADRFLDMVGLGGYGPRYPDQLSGGQQQRVALARSFAARPKLILLDEPFSNLDAALRAKTRREIRRILKATGLGVLFVTHDQEEALSFADRLAVMREGRILQIGRPEEVYARPASAFVAQFLGRTNLLAGAARGAQAETPLGLLPLAAPAEGEVLLSLRPEDLGLEPDAAGAGEIVGREFKGHDATYWVRAAGAEWQADAMGPPLMEIGTRVILRAKAPAVPLGAE